MSPENESTNELSDAVAQFLAAEGLEKDELKIILEAAHPVDLAGMIENLGLEDKLRIFELINPARAAQILDEMHPSTKKALLNHVQDETLASMIKELPPESGADVMNLLSTHREQKILSQMDTQRIETLKTLKQYPPQSAGGVMTTNFVSVPESMTAGEVLKIIQGAVNTETIEYVYVIDEEERLKGVLSMRQILMATPETPVNQAMHREVQSVLDVTDQEDVARLAKKYTLRAVPVVDIDRHLLGVVTMDHIMEVVHQEASEDMFKMAGAATIHPVYDSVLRRVKLRIPWLIIPFGALLLNGLVIKGFDETLKLETALVAFMPLIMAMGGNVGLQSTITIVRGLGTGEMSISKTMRVFLIEGRVGLLIGLVTGVLAGVAAWLLNIHSQRSIVLGFIVGISVSVCMLLSSLMGTLTPIIFHRFKVDPAAASGPFITAMNDILSVVIYLALASFLIIHT